MLGQPSFAEWSPQDRSDFSELLWIAEAEENIDVKIRMVRFISCITKYYEEHYPFAKVLERWHSTEIDADFLSEFIFVNDRCDERISNDEDVSDI